jgi:tetratricopeptide (TPR) repeat protein
MIWRFYFMSERRRKLLTALAIAVTAATIACAPRLAAASLSEQLSQRIAEARKAERDRNFDAALAIYEKAMTMDHATPEGMHLLLKNRSGLFEQINLFDHAEADLTEVFSVVPSDATAYADRGYFYMRRGRYRAALDDFVTGSRLDPQNPLYMYAAARSLVAAQDYAGAVGFYTEAIKFAPADGKLYLARAEALVRTQRWSEAQADYDRAQRLGLAKRSEKYFAFAGSGYVAMMLADYDVAMVNLDRALAIDPDAVNVIMWRGHVQERRGDMQAALRDYERASRLRPEDTRFRDNARRVYAALK